MIRLSGGGENGFGEDVTYHADEHDLEQARGAILPVAGDWTLQTFSDHVGTLPLFDHEPEQHAYLDYRRWSFESAALDLALRQAGLSLGSAVGRVPRPLTFVVSMRLGEPATTERLRAWIDHYPGLRFKLDATPDWSDDLVAELAATGAVDSVDFKGQYRGTSVDTVPDAALYQRVVDGLPDAWLEDPALTPETEVVLEPHQGRVTWDAVIHSVADIEALRWPPRTVNVKPSRFGSVARLFEAYDYCAAQRDRRLRRGPVRARRRSRPDPAAGGGLPPGDSERRRARGVQPRSPAGTSVEPAHDRRTADRVRGHTLSGYSACPDPGLACGKRTGLQLGSPLLRVPEQGDELRKRLP